MKRFFKIFGIFFLIILILGGIFWAYIYFKPTKYRSVFTLIPDDAIFMIETKNLSKGWKEISSSEIWKNLTENEYFSDINKSASVLDSLIRNNGTMSSLLENRQLFISSHMISGVDYDFIFYVDLEQISKLSFILDFLNNSIVEQFDYSLSRFKIKEDEIIKLTHNTSGDEFYASFIDNFAVITYSPVLIEEVVEHKADTAFIHSNKFLKVQNNLDSRKYFHLYLNYGQLERFLNCYVEKTDDISASIMNYLYYSAFDFSLSDKHLELVGYTSFHDSTSSFLNALYENPASEMSIYNVLSKNTALYVSMTFKDFTSLQESLISQYRNFDTVRYNEYSKQQNFIEKFLKISLKDDIFSWVGNEIAFVKMKPQVGFSNEDDVLAVIQANDVEKAGERLNHVMKQVRKRSPLKFDEVKYMNHDIYFLNIKGLFKVFFGKLFKKLDTPYFVIIEDFVFFSNSLEVLKEIIDDYLKKDVLSQDLNFIKFMKQFEKQGNMNIFVRMPKMYSLLYYYGNAEKKKAIKKNKALILSFSQLGFQLYAKDSLFYTTLISDYDINALLDDETERFEAAIEEMQSFDVENLLFNEVMSDLDIREDSSGIVQLKLSDNDTVVRGEGSVIHGVAEGLWRFYYVNGNIESSVIFENGKADGVATFYYDDEQQSVKAKATFKQGSVEDVLREYYRNGVRKAQIEFKKGRAEGIAEYYYNNGNLMIQGRFHKGEKSGNWRHYTEDGQLFDKEKIKKSKQN